MNGKLLFRTTTDNLYIDLLEVRGKLYLFIQTKKYIPLSSIFIPDFECAEKHLSEITNREIKIPIRSYK